MVVFHIISNDSEKDNFSEITQEPSVSDENIGSQTSDSEDPEEDIPF